MNVITKHPLKVLQINHLRLPSHCRVLSAGEQDGTLYVWVLGDPRSNYVEHEVLVFGTGLLTDTLDETDSVSWQFIQTVQMTDGYVWHMFVKVPLK